MLSVHHLFVAFQDICHSNQRHTVQNIYIYRDIKYFNPYKGNIPGDKQFKIAANAKSQQVLA